MQRRRLFEDMSYRVQRIIIAILFLSSVSSINPSTCLVKIQMEYAKLQVLLFNSSACSNGYSDAGTTAASGQTGTSIRVMDFWYPFYNETLSNV